MARRRCRRHVHRSRRLFDQRAGTLQVLKTPSTPRNQSEGILATASAGSARCPQARAHRARHHGCDQHGAGAQRGAPRRAGDGRPPDVLVVGRGNRTVMYDIKARARCRPWCRDRNASRCDERMRVDGSVDPGRSTRRRWRRSPERLRGAKASRRWRSASCTPTPIRSTSSERRSWSPSSAARRRRSRPRARCCPSIREYERFITTALNAYVAPRMRRYLGDSLRQVVSDRPACRRRWPIMTSNGGSLPAAASRRCPCCRCCRGRRPA